MFHLEISLIFFLLVALPYFSTNNIAHAYLETVWDPEIGLDRNIPVINWMILPYAILYCFYPATLFLCPRDDRGRAELAVAMQALIMVTAFCCIIFLILPAEIDLRDQIEWDSMSGWEMTLFEFIHFSDNPWNSWPSLHVVHSYLLARVMTEWISRNGSESKLWKILLVFLWLEWALLCISIMTTKQHYFFDLVSGVFVAHISWIWTKSNIDEISSKGLREFIHECGWNN